MVHRVPLTVTTPHYSEGVHAPTYTDLKSAQECFRLMSLDMTQIESDIADLGEGGGGGGTPALPLSYQVLTDDFTYVVPEGDGGVIIDSGDGNSPLIGEVTGNSVEMPANAVDDQRCLIGFSIEVDQLSVVGASGEGQTINDAANFPEDHAGGTCREYIYKEETTTWYRSV